MMNEAESSCRTLGMQSFECLPANRYQGQIALDTNLRTNKNDLKIKQYSTYYAAYDGSGSSA